MLKLLLIYGFMLVLLLVGSDFVRYRYLRPLYEQKAYFRQLHQRLAVGQQVRCIDQQQGTIVGLTNEKADIRLVSGNILEISRCCILAIVENETGSKM